MAINEHGETWQTVKKTIEDRLAMHRATLEGETIPQEKTQALRGRIAALKEILALPQTINQEAHLQG